MAESESDREMKNSENSAFSPLQTCLAMSSSQPYRNITQSPSTLFQSGGQSLSHRLLGSALTSPTTVTRQRNNMMTELMEQLLPVFALLSELPGLSLSSHIYISSPD